MDSFFSPTFLMNVINNNMTEEERETKTIYNVVQKTLGNYIYQISDKQKNLISKYHSMSYLFRKAFTSSPEIHYKLFHKITINLITLYSLIQSDLFSSIDLINFADNQNNFTRLEYVSVFITPQYETIKTLNLIQLYFIEKIYNLVFGMISPLKISSHIYYYHILGHSDLHDKNDSIDPVYKSLQLLHEVHRDYPMEINTKRDTGLIKYFDLCRAKFYDISFNALNMFTYFLKEDHLLCFENISHSCILYHKVTQTSEEIISLREKELHDILNETHIQLSLLLQTIRNNSLFGSSLTKEVILRDHKNLSHFLPLPQVLINVTFEYIIDSNVMRHYKIYSIN